MCTSWVPGCCGRSDDPLPCTVCVHMCGGSDGLTCRVCAQVGRWGMVEGEIMHSHALCVYGCAYLCVCGGHGPTYTICIQVGMV